MVNSLKPFTFQRSIFSQPISNFQKKVRYERENQRKRFSSGRISSGTNFEEWPQSANKQGKSPRRCRSQLSNLQQKRGGESVCLLIFLLIKWSLILFSILLSFLFVFWFLTVNVLFQFWFVPLIEFWRRFAFSKKVFQYEILKRNNWLDADNSKIELKKKTKKSSKKNHQNLKEM